METTAASDWIEIIRASPLTPWIGGALLLFVAMTLIKVVTRVIGKLLVLGAVAAAAYFGWQWWTSMPADDVHRRWVESVRNVDWTQESLEQLARDSADMAQETIATSREKGREVTEAALQSVDRALDSRIREAAERGETEARQRLESIREGVRRQLEKF